MDNVLIDIFRHKGTEILLLLHFGSIIVCFRGQVVRVLSCHQVKVVRLDALNNLSSLRSVAVLEESLKDSASVVFKAQLLVFATY